MIPDEFGYDNNPDAPYDDCYDHNQREREEIECNDEPGESTGFHHICNICGHKFTDEEMISVFNAEYSGGKMWEDLVSPCCMNFNFNDVEDES